VLWCEGLKGGACYRSALIRAGSGKAMGGERLEPHQRPVPSATQRVARRGGAMEDSTDACALRCVSLRVCVRLPSPSPIVIWQLTPAVGTRLPLHGRREGARARAHDKGRTI
jgi:hypothetical protein